MKKLSATIQLVVYITLLSACGSEKMPFEAEYTSPNEVIITYLGKQYSLNRFQQNDGFPFEYSFEADGDLDLIIDGKEYEIDSPYDVDKKKKSVKKKKTYVKKKKK